MMWHGANIIALAACGSCKFSSCSGGGPPPEYCGQVLPGPNNSTELASAPDIATIMETSQNSPPTMSAEANTCSSSPFAQFIIMALFRNEPSMYAMLTKNADIRMAMHAMPNQFMVEPYQMVLKLVGSPVVGGAGNVQPARAIATSANASNPFLIQPPKPLEMTFVSAFMNAIVMMRFIAGRNTA